MVKQIIRKHIKKIAVGILIILALALVINIYGDFVQPFIDPYFFKIGNIEKIVGAKLPSAFMLEYDIIPEPSYRFAGTKGIKEIFATVQINESEYETLKNKKYFDESNPVWSMEDHVKKYMTEKKGYESFDIEDFEEIKIKHRIVPLGEHVYHGIGKIYRSGPATAIFIVLTKEKIDKVSYRYLLCVFNEVD